MHRAQTRGGTKDVQMSSFHETSGPSHLSPYAGRLHILRVLAEAGYRVSSFAHPRSVATQS